MARTTSQVPQVGEVPERSGVNRHGEAMSAIPVVPPTPGVAPPTTHIWTVCPSVEVVMAAAWSYTASGPAAQLVHELVEPPGVVVEDCQSSAKGVMLPSALRPPKIQARLDEPE